VKTTIIALFAAVLITAAPALHARHVSTNLLKRRGRPVNELA
jgi:hypothetical protein